MSRIAQLTLAGALAASAACSSGEATDDSGNPPGNNQNPPTNPGGTPAPTASVNVDDNLFSPNSVLLAVGGTVTWTWGGNNGHSVTPDGSTSFSPVAGVSYPPKTLLVTFPTTGDYHYFCTVHGVAGYYSTGDMVGAVYVR